jgi:hypothetical protein
MSGATRQVTVHGLVCAPRERNVAAEDLDGTLSLKPATLWGRVGPIPKRVTRPGYDGAVFLGFSVKEAKGNQSPLSPDS